MSKKKLSPIEVILKKLSAVAMTTFASKSETYTKQEVDALLASCFGYSRVSGSKIQFFHSAADATAYDGGNTSKLLRENDLVSTVSDFTISGEDRITVAGTYSYTITNVTPANAINGIASLSVTAGNLTVVVNGTSGFSITVSSIDVTTDVNVTVVATLESGDTITRTIVVTLSNEPNYVDLGLPSGLLWADTNIGATTPEEKGLYFSWGNTVGYGEGESYNFTEDYNNTPGAALTGNIGLSNDAAHALYGGDWRMPSRYEYEELLQNTDYEWTTLNGVNGYKFMKESDHDVFIFLPAVGRRRSGNVENYGNNTYYWSTSYRESTSAYFLSGSETSIKSDQTGGRSFGFNIRAVKPAPSQS